MILINPYATKKIRWIGYLWIALPIVYTLYSKLIFGVHWDDLLKMILSPLYWGVCLFGTFTGFTILQIRWYSWYLFLASNFFLVYQNALILVYYSHLKYRFVIFSVNCVLQLLMIFFVSKEVRVPYFFPRIRWWESDPRYKLTVHTKLTRNTGQEFEGETLDISIGGCFVKTHLHFLIDEIITIHMTLFDETFECKGRVVWRAESRVTHPRGVGIKFEGISKQQHNSLKFAVHKIRKLSRSFGEMSRQRSWEDYLQREQNYQGKKKSS